MYVLSIALPDSDIHANISSGTYSLHFGLTLHLINYIKNIVWTEPVNFCVELFTYSKLLLSSYFLKTCTEVCCRISVLTFRLQDTFCLCFLQVKIFLPIPCRAPLPTCPQGNHCKIGGLFIFKLLKLTFCSVLEPVKIKSVEGPPFASVDFRPGSECYFIPIKFVPFSPSDVLTKMKIQITMKLLLVLLLSLPYSPFCPISKG